MVVLRLLRCVVVLFSVWPCAALAQQPSMAGRVGDETGGGLPGVSVQAASTDGKTTRIVTTNETGHYQFESLPAGRYDVTFSEMNFASVRRRNVIVPATGAGPRVDAILQVALSAQVVVTGRRTFRNLADLDRPSENLVGVAGAASEGAVTGAQIAARPIMRSAEVLEAVPGLVISQHSGEGKANQYYLRGFNLDHGTDFATTVAGIPVNLPSHAHGQGYADANFLIPELVTGVQFRKGPYYTDTGDFSAAGAANINYANVLDQSIAIVSAGQAGWSRALFAASPRVAGGHLLAALELNHHDGPWERPDDYRRVNSIVRFSRDTPRNAFSITALGYQSDWNSTDQVPQRAVDRGTISRFGAIDPTAGGRTARYSSVGDYQHKTDRTLTRASVFVSKYRLNLFSNFTYALDDPEAGDQFEQVDRRWLAGARLSHKRQVRSGDRSGENTFGLDVRHDDISAVGLYRTSAQRRLDTTREDAVMQTSVGLFAENAMRWTPWLRTTTGLRFDRYGFNVRSDAPVNSGIATAGLLSPKASMVLGPWRATELYLNAGTGFHSNDARGSTITIDPATGHPAERVTPLVRATGAEVGFRSVVIPRVQTTVALWQLTLDSELLFAGDAGTTEASRPSHRYGLEWSSYVRLPNSFAADADVAWSHARFSDADPTGNRIPGAPNMIVSAGLTAEAIGQAFGSIRFRYFGRRPLVEDGRVMSSATGLVNAQIGYHVRQNLHLMVDVFNLLNATASDIDYFYASRLPGEPAGGIDDLHSHPAPPRTARLVLRVQF